jgi:DNA-directed RNA polymerase subunit L
LVWKYRCKHSDLSRGASGGYRIIAVYDAAHAILRPILLYAKVDSDDVSAGAVKRAVEELREALKAAGSGEESAET